MDISTKKSKIEKMQVAHWTRLFRSLLFFLFSFFFYC